MNVNGEFWKKHICYRIREVDKQAWTMALLMKECPRIESFAGGNVGAGVRLMVRGGCLPVRGSERMAWKYEDDKYRCGLLETEKHVLFECTLYREERGRWREAVRDLKDGMEKYEIIKGTI